MKKKNGVPKLHLNFKIRLKNQNSTFLFYFLKISNRLLYSFCKCNLGDATDQINTRVQKKFSKKITEIDFSSFFEK